jgi:hypothetical protein
MTRRKTEAKQTNQQIIKGTEGISNDLILGYQIHWTVSEKTLSVAEMETILANTLGPNFMPKQPRKKTKLRRAMDAISKTRSVVRIKEDATMIYYALVDEIPDKIKIDVNLDKLAIAAYDKIRDKLEFRGGKPEAQQDIRSTFERFLTEYDKHQVRAVPTQYAQANFAVRMNKHSHIFFVRDIAIVKALESYINALNNDSDFYYLPILNIPEAKKTMITKVKNQLATEVEELAEEVKRMHDAKFTRGATVVDRMEKFKEARKRCEAYADMLKTDADELIRQVEELRNEVRASIEGEQIDYPQRKNFPLGAQVIYNGKAIDSLGSYGEVSGYKNSESGKHYVKVKFSKANKIVPTAPSNLKIIASK